MGVTEEGSWGRPFLASRGGVPHPSTTFGLASGVVSRAPQREERGSHTQVWEGPGSRPGVAKGSAPERPSVSLVFDGPSDTGRGWGTGPVKGQPGAPEPAAGLAPEPSQQFLKLCHSPGCTSPTANNIGRCRSRNLIPWARGPPQLVSSRLAVSR